jgi:hypothetical protein
MVGYMMDNGKKPEVKHHNHDEHKHEKKKKK